MNTSAIIKAAWQRVVHYRALWVFGFILALTTVSWGTLAALSSSGDGDQSDAGIQIQRRSYETFPEAFERAVREEFDQAAEELDTFFAQELNLTIESDIVTILIGLAVFAAALYVIGKVARYVSETALIRLVDRREESGQESGVREGFRLGWSPVALRLYLITAIVNLVAAAAGLLLFAIIFSPLPLWVEGSEMTVIAGAIITGALFFVVIFVLVVGGMGVTLVQLFSWRAAALEGLGITASVYRGYTLVRRNLKQLLPLGLVGLGVNLAYPALIGLLAVLLFGLGLMLGGVPGLLVAGLASLASAGETAVIIGIAVGTLILFAVIIAPLALVDGIREVFLSGMWTLAFRELVRMESEVEQMVPDLPLDEALSPIRGPRNTARDQAGKHPGGA